MNEVTRVCSQKVYKFLPPMTHVCPSVADPAVGAVAPLDGSWVLISEISRAIVVKWFFNSSFVSDNLSTVPFSLATVP